MKVFSVQEMEDKTLKFEGELSATEAAYVTAFGLNTMMAMGLMHLIPGITSEEYANEGPIQ